MKTAIIGAGTWGTALSRAIALKTEEVTVWTCIPEEAERLTRERAHWNLPGMTVPGNVSFTTDGEEAVRARQLAVDVGEGLVLEAGGLTPAGARPGVNGHPAAVLQREAVHRAPLIVTFDVVRVLEIMDGAPRRVSRLIVLFYVFRPV